MLPYRTIRRDWERLETRAKVLQTAEAVLQQVGGMKGSGGVPFSQRVKALENQFSREWEGLSGPNRSAPSAKKRNNLVKDQKRRLDNLLAQIAKEGPEGELFVQAYRQRTADLQLTDETAPTVDVDTGPPARHSLDFRSVHWYGEDYTFTKNQALCVKVLWAAWEERTPEIGGTEIVARADVTQTRFIDVFRSNNKNHPAWGTMIVPGHSRGAYCLGEHGAGSRPKNTRKKSRKTHR
ncbi:MAG: hypothetical protein ABSG86_27625 [Thermoguttaceae bacterium]|jgi:hypothetical protein